MTGAYRDYALASSGLALCLSVVAIGGLVWEQRQGRLSPMDQSDTFKPILPSAAAPLETSLMSPTSDPTLPMWSSVLLRTVGLCNLLGLLLQIAVGIGVLLPAMDGLVLEIIALNHFGLFVQGIATGLLLGGLPEAPVVRVVTHGTKAIACLWMKCMDWYVDPRLKAS